MRRSRNAALVGAFFMLPLLGGDDFAPIPPEVWAIKSGPKGAVVLEERMTFGITTVEHVWRVRIFSEEGRGAAEIEDLPANAYRIKGRTVYPDGRVVEFNQRKDFGERRVETGSEGLKSLHLVAPGVTADCVVEVRWNENADGILKGLPHRYSSGLYGTWTLVNAYPTQLEVVEVPHRFPLAWSIQPGAFKPEVTKSMSTQVFTFRNLPAVELPPYALWPMLGAPRLVMFWQPDNMNGPAKAGLGDGYWKDGALAYYKEDYVEGIDKGRAYRALAAEILTGLPKEPVAAACELKLRLDKRIANVSLATFEEAAALPKSFWQELKPKDLDQAAKTGRTSSKGILLLYFHLLKEIGIKPLIAKVPDREVSFFNWNQLNLWQFHQDLIGIQEPGKDPAWIDPTLRFAAPGVVHPDYTGVPALVINSADWSCSKGGVPVSRLPNTRKYSYTLDLGDEGDRFKVVGEFGGYPEYQERRRYMALEPKEQAKALKERFEKALTSLVVERAEVQHSGDAKVDLSWQLEGVLEREAGRKRVVDPFPGMPWPLWVPSKVDDQRKAAIVIPYLSSQVATATFKVPEGFTMPPHEELKREGEFGRVFWLPTYDPATRTVKVVLRVDVQTVHADAAAWPAFRTFLGWVEDACRRQVTLVKGS